MAHSKLYRSFIILQEDERGHSVSKEKPLSGYAKIEVKSNICKVAFYAQNLKKEYENCHMMLICNKKDTKVLLNLGTMNITAQGKSESSHEFDATDIGKTSIGYDKVVGAALCKEVAGKMIFLMCGFLNGEQPTTNWKDYKKVACSKEKQDLKKEYVKEDKESKKSKMHDEKKKEKDSKDCSKTKHNDEHHEHHEHDEHHDHHEHHHDDDCCCDECKGREKFAEYEEGVERKLRGDESFELTGPMGDFFNTVIDGLEPQRLTNEIKRCKWYKAPVKSFEDMCNISNYNKYTTLYYPMTNYYPYIAKHEHFMIGLKADEEGKVAYVIYAIPGTKAKHDQPYNGKTGFVTFAPNTPESEEGYWLMFYDFKNSMVVVPMK